MFVARPEEQSIDEADNMPSYVPMVSIGLNNSTSVTPEEEGNTAVVDMDYDAPIEIMETGLRCKYCVYDTASQVPADTDIYHMVQLLQIHADVVHGVGVVNQDYDQHGVEVNAEVVHVDSDAPTMAKQMDQVHDGFVAKDTDITAATIAELADAAGTTVPKGWTKFSSRSNKSKQRKKSRRF